MKRHSAGDAIVSADGEEVIIAGFHAVTAALNGGTVYCIYADAKEKGSRLRECLTKAEALSIAVKYKSPSSLAGLSGDIRHQGIAARVRLPSCQWRELLDNFVEVVVLDGVTDPRNLGAIMRIAHAFAAAAVIIPKRRSAPLSAVALRAAGAAAACLPVIRITNVARALSQLRAAGYTVAAATDDAEETFTAALQRPVCWVFGDEGKGLRRLTRENCDHLLRIPTVAGDAGCLNVSAACAICLAASRLTFHPPNLADGKANRLPE